MRSVPGEARTILLLHVISSRPSKQLTASYGTYLPQGLYGARLLLFVCARTNKRHHDESARTLNSATGKCFWPPGSFGPTVTEMILVKARCLTMPRPGWAPDPLIVGIRSPDGLVVGLAPATLEFWVRFPNERNYVGAEECAPASPYKYSSSTGVLMSAHLSRLRLFQRHPRSLVWVWVWVWDWVHTPPHTLLSFSPPSFHTISLSLACTRA